MAPRPLREPLPLPQLRLLGAPGWRAPSDSGWRPLARKDAALLALLALEGPQPRQRAAELLWTEVDPARALANLRQRLFRLRQAGGMLVVEADGRLTLAPEVACDLTDTSSAADAAQVDQWSAPLLGSESYESEGAALAQWVDTARATWASRLPGRLSDIAAAFERDGALAPAIAACERLLQCDPLLEHGWRRLMRLHHLRGDRGAAVAAFERCERVLRDELGLRPGQETVSLLAEVEAAVPPAEAAAAPRPAPLPASLRRPPRLIGRGAVCDAMHRSWDEGAAFLLVGHAGLGKSRLLSEWAAGHPGRVLSGARPGDDAAAYGLVSRMLRAVIAAGLGPAPERLPPAATRELARLLPDFGPAPASPGHPTLLQDAVIGWLEAAASSGLRALLLDDLQHADASSLQWLPALSAGTPALHWGLASRTAASGPLTEWMSGSGRPTVIPLDGLDEGALAELLTSMPALGLPAGMVPAFARRLHGHCGGNPLFVLETLRALHGRSPVPEGNAPLPLPSNVERLLDQRLAALSPPALALAQVAAIVGSDFDAGIAADVLGGTAESLAAPWSELETAQVLAGDGMAHDTLSEVLRRGLPAPMRTQLHGRVARCLAARGAAPDRVCRHHAEAAEWSAAAGAALQAAHQAMIRGRRDVELAHRQQAAAWFDQAGDESAAFRARVQALEAMALHTGLDQATAEAERLHPIAPRPADLGALCAARMQLDLWRGHGLSAARHAEAGLATVSDPLTRLRLQLGQAAGLASAGHREEAQRLSDPLRPLLEAQSDPLVACELWDLQAQIDHYTHRVLDCLRSTERLLGVARSAGHVQAELDALGTLTGLHDMLGRGADAVATGRAARSLHRRLGDSLTARAQDLNLAYALFGSGHFGEALELLESTLAYAGRTAPASLLHEGCQDMLADLWLTLGDPRRALSQFDDEGSIGSSARRQHRIDLRARAALQLGDRAGAEALWTQLDDLLAAELRGGMDLRMRCHASQRLAGEAAQQACTDLLARAEALASPVGRAVARLFRGLAALRAGDLPTASGDASQLLALLEAPAPLRHGYLDPLQVCALAVEAGEASRAQALARAWLDERVIPHTPAAWLPGLMARWPMFSRQSGSG